MNRNVKITAMHVDDDDDIDDNLSFGLDSAVSDTSGSIALAVSPPSRLLSHDLETDIDSEEPDLDTLLKQKWNSCDNVFDLKDHKNRSCSVDLTKKLVFETPAAKSAKIPNFLPLDLKEEKSRPKSKRSISPCAHVLELERLSTMSNVSESLPLDSLSQGKIMRAGAKVQESNKSSSIKDSKKTKFEETNGSLGQSQVYTIYTRPSTTSPQPLTPDRPLSATYRSDESLNFSAVTPCTGKEKPVTFQTEVAMATPKHSPSHTLDKGMQSYEIVHKINISMKI
jgi:hypothetical protein